MRTTYGIALTLGLVAAFMTFSAPADQGTIPKWSQPPVDGVGENIPSTIDWRDMGPNPEFGGTSPNWNIADDFRSDGRPVLTVRWWGSYFPAIQGEPSTAPPPGAIEDTFILSFFADIPVEESSTGFSMPGTLLGTYIAPITAVKIDDAEMSGWDLHAVWQYEVNLQDTHLEHQSPLATRISFNEMEGIIYWLSITASNGHELTTGPAGEWLFEPTSDPQELEHWWGWHTSPIEFNDVPTMSTLAMGGLGECEYLDWQRIDPQHFGTDMAFELFTIPIPGAVWLFAPALVGLGMLRRRDIA